MWRTPEVERVFPLRQAKVASESREEMHRRLERIAEATPTTRDRYVDFLRAVSILVVVVGHWFIGMIHWRGGVIRTTSAIGVTPWL